MALTPIDDGIIEAVAKSTPPITVSVLGVGITIHEWVYIATFVYVVLQIVIIVPKVFRTMFKKKDEAKDDKEASK